jgi:hypothetical protein
MADESSEGVDERALAETGQNTYLGNMGSEGAGDLILDDLSDGDQE